MTIEEKREIVNKFKNGNTQERNELRRYIFNLDLSAKEKEQLWDNITLRALRG